MDKKVVRSFTVDEEVYSWLVEKLKEANIGIGVSSLLDGYLKYLYQGLKEIFAYIEKNKINIPSSYVVYKYMDDQAFFYQYDWEAIKNADKHGDFRKEIDREISGYVNELLEELKEKHKGRWTKQVLDRDIAKLNRD